MEAASSSDMDTRTEQILSLCTGAGGLDRGVHMALGNTRVVCCVEHEASACELLATRMEEGRLDDAPLWTNLHTFDGIPWRGLIHGVIGGYPCQPFSVAGKRLGTADPRHLWPSISRIIGECAPDWCFFENVAGHLRLGYWDVVRPDLERLGYRVAEGIFTAAEVGAPHRRERLFILAHASSAGRQQNPGRAPIQEAGADGGNEPEHRGNADVAHATRGGLGERGEPSGGNGQPDGRYGPLEHTTRAQRTRGTGSGTDGERWAPGSSEGDRPMADTGIGQLPQPEWGSQGRTGAGSAGALDDADLTRLEGWQQSERERCYKLPAFPPGPSDSAAWGRILAERPDLAPSVEPPVRGMANGVPDRVDELSRAAQLRLLGNAVVAPQAALAFRTLWRQLADTGHTEQQGRDNEG